MEAERTPSARLQECPEQRRLSVLPLQPPFPEGGDQASFTITLPWA